jgi:hypothetical protein
MTHCNSISAFGSEFDDFLFAPIGEDRNGMLLSVLSALARLDVDPWKEAEELAQLPRETAAQRLASLIAALPGGPLDPSAVATRLITLLPRRAGFDISSQETMFGISAISDPRGFIYVIVIFVSLVLGALWMIASHQQTQVDNAPNPAPRTFFPQAPRPDASQ